MFNSYIEAGGNFLDTSDSYQFGESEELVGQFIRQVRDDVVLATKYTQGAGPKGSVSVTGNSRKAMVGSLEQSLKRLGTDRVDLYWVHMPDGVTPIDEIMRFPRVARLGGGYSGGASRVDAHRRAADRIQSCRTHPRA